MKTIICPECNTENEPQYIFCKNCGKQLAHSENNGESAAGFSPHVTYTNDYTAHTEGQIVDTIDSVPTEDIETYIGKKANTVLPKFSKMELTGSKVSWCWPVALLGFFMGPVGAAMWFFYRKIYKVACILLAIGLVVTVATTLLSSDTVLMQESIAKQIESGKFDIDEMLDVIDEAESAYSPLANSINNIVDTLTMVICGMFAFYFYKKSIIKNIEKYKTKNVDPRYYRMGLAAIGGTSIGMAILGLVTMSVVTELCTIIIVLVF